MNPTPGLAFDFRRQRNPNAGLPPARPDITRRHRAPNAATVVDPVITPSMREVERIVTRLANAHDELPNNPVLGELAGRRRNTILRALRRLESAGLLLVEKDGNRRRCTIVASGRSTGWGEARPGHSPYMHYRPGDPARKPAPGRPRQPASRPLPAQLAPGANRAVGFDNFILMSATGTIHNALDVRHIPSASDRDANAGLDAPSCQFPMWADGERPGVNPRFCCGPVLHRTHFCAEHASACLRRPNRPAARGMRQAA